jgi:hypothetical protein
MPKSIIMRRLAVAGTALAIAAALSGCGRMADLSYPVGASGPATPAGASAPPTPPELIAPTVQSRPKRNDELLKRSDEREADEFDLPPA